MDMCPYIVLRKCVQEFAGLEILEQLGGCRKTGRVGKRARTKKCVASEVNLGTLTEPKPTLSKISFELC
jgi:hypothetical protein